MDRIGERRPRVPPHMEMEREQQRQTYQLCRLGFAIVSIALVIACITTVLGLIGLFTGRMFVGGLINEPWWRWLDTPVVWGSLIGVYLLWGRWSHASWQRRAGLLLLMCVADLVLWFFDHGQSLGLFPDVVGHNWLRDRLGSALGWAEFALISSLACDLLAHLGVEHAPDAGKATRTLAASGAVVWMFLFCLLTDWEAGWPLQHRPLLPETFLLLLGTDMIWTITLFQVTALTIAATRQSSRVLLEMDKEDQHHDLLSSPSDRHDPFATSGKKSGIDLYDDERW